MFNFTILEMCPHGYDMLRSGQCVKQYKQRVPKATAITNCIDAGTKLVSVRTKDQESAIFDYLKFRDQGIAFLYIKTWHINK